VLDHPPRVLIGANQVFGALLVTQAHLFTPGVREPSLAFMMAALSVAALSGAAGLSLIRGQPLGLALSVWLQALQVVGIATPAFSWRLELGVKVTAEVNSSAFATHFGFSGLYAIWPMGTATQLTVTLNALALVAFVYLYRMRRQIKIRQGAA
jgi:hypothetical protein